MLLVFSLSVVAFPSVAFAQICTREDCGNHGSCVGLKTFPICMCDIGYAGTRCEHDLDSQALCDSKVGCSGNGLCIGTKDDFSCACFIGYEGEMCQHKIEGSNALLPTMPEACSAADCNNQGVCIGTKQLPFCLCNLGRIGKYCEKSVNSLGKPRIHQWTMSTVNTDPNAPITTCSPSDCNNKGICFGTKNSFVCACQLGYTGSRCENISGTMCEASDCNSAGLCIGTKKQFTCVCNLGYTGDRCQDRVGILPGFEGAICEAKDCSGNGICIGSKLAPLCICAPEPLCNPLIHCTGNGMCVGTVKSFTCFCNLGWTGVTCAQPTLLG
ncbi:EGF-like domain protein [Ancylostoma ceylanicum]|uniref:EGF-like domain protein n=1 Tax=Ancylostoma ceylanicum TaxID=53326 RepID=A0A0D6L785_9BILA|nr:EGF-like domain protein [Ancylostoma ceylanicum]